MSLSSKNNKRTKIRGSIVKKIMFRQEYKCANCVSILSPANQVDHIVPYSISQDDSEDNLQVLCANCHALKSFDENYRISKYKKIRDSYTNRNVEVCWFCLESYDKKVEVHSCEKIMKNITTFLKDYDTTMTKRKRDDKDFMSRCNKLKNISIKEEPSKMNDEILQITIKEDSVKCKDKIFKYDAYDITVENIGHVIIKSVDNIKDENRYSEILIKFEMELDPEEYDFKNGLDEATDHIIKYLPDFIPPEIIKDGMIIINLC